MSFALWITPVVLASLAVILWVASWLERLVAAPGFATGLRPSLATVAAISPAARTEVVREREVL